MAVQLDTTGLLPGQRVAALEAVLDTTDAPVRFRYDRPLDQVSSWMASWQLGGRTVLQSRGSALRGTRGPREVAASGAALLAVCCSTRGRMRGLRDREELSAREGEVVLFDMTEPHALEWPDGYDTFGVALTHDELGLPPAVLRRAVRTPERSPVRPLLTRHLVRTFRALPALDGTAAGAVLDETTVDLVRTLLLSAAGAPGPAAEALHAALPLRVEQYVLQHLGDPDLTAARIAAAHHVSLRALYYAWASRDRGSLAGWIAEQRLARAARELSGTRDAVAAVARRCGFRDATHFSRRFRAHHGVSPREWRLLTNPAAVGSGAGSAPPRGPSRAR